MSFPPLFSPRNLLIYSPMKRLIDFHVDWFFKFQEWAFDLMNRGSDVYMKEIRFLKVKQETYVAMSRFFLNLLYEVNRSPHVPTDPGSEALRLIKSLNEDTYRIFQEFEPGMSYENRGDVESFVEMGAKQVQRAIPLPGAATKAIYEVMEEYWNRFFRLVNPGNYVLQTGVPCTPPYDLTDLQGLHGWFRDEIIRILDRP